MTERVDCVVIGAGVVGLATARALAMTGRDVLIVEAADAYGTEVSARNSEVIHAGLYYPPGSHKAAMCVRGNALLYAYCEERGIPHRRLGKLIVAVDATQRAALQAIEDNARACGVRSLVPVDADGAADLEPAIACAAALYSPNSGIVDSHALMTSLLGDAEAAGATLALASRVVGGASTTDGIRLHVASGATGAEPPTQTIDVVARVVVNAAGLDATDVARAIDGMRSDSIPRTYRVKGNYFSLDGRSPFAHLVYPLPDDSSLGVHCTLDLGGQARFGPDVQWPVDDAEPDLAVDETRRAAFVDAVARYWPAVRDATLSPAYAGLRPRITGRGEPLADFDFCGPARHGIAGLVHLFGIESPGLTSSLAIAEHVVDLVGS